MKRIFLALGLAGLGLTVFLALRERASIEALFSLAGWGLLWLVPYRLVPVTLDSAGWQVLLRKQEHYIPFPYITWVAAVRDAVNSLLPVFGPSGMVAGSRLLLIRDIDLTASLASMVAEGTITLVSQFLFVAAGIALLATERVNGTARVLSAVLPAMAIGAPLLALVLIAQRRSGVYQRLERAMERILTKRLFAFVAGSPMRLHRELHVLYSEKSVFAKSCLWQLAGLFAGAGEVWLVLRLFHQPATPGGAILLESLGQLIRASGSILPAGLGVQEAGFILFGQMIGLAPGTGLAVSLAKRFREVAFGLPVLCSWQWLEGRRLSTR